MPLKGPDLIFDNNLRPSCTANAVDYGDRVPEYGTAGVVDLAPDADSGSNVSGGQRLGEGLSF